jgi:hypothetical protein
MRFLGARASLALVPQQLELRLAEGENGFLLVRFGAWPVGTIALFATPRMNVCAKAKCDAAAFPPRYAGEEAAATASPFYQTQQAYIGIVHYPSVDDGAPIGGASMNGELVMNRSMFPFCGGHRMAGRQHLSPRPDAVPHWVPRRV